MRHLSEICRWPCVGVALVLSAHMFLTACQNVPGEQAQELEFFADVTGIPNHILAGTTQLGRLQTMTTTLTGETVFHEWRTLQGTPVSKDDLAQVQMCANTVDADTPGPSETTTQERSKDRIEESLWKAFVGCMENQGLRIDKQSIRRPSDFIFGLRHGLGYLGAWHFARGKENTLEGFKEDVDACAGRVRSGWNGKMKTYTFTPFTTGTSVLPTLAVSETMKTIEPAARELQQCMEGFGYIVEKR